MEDVLSVQEKIELKGLNCTEVLCKSQDLITIILYLHVAGISTSEGKAHGLVVHMCSARDYPDVIPQSIVDNPFTTKIIQYNISCISCSYRGCTYISKPHAVTLG